jgi:cytochrome c-type biogenesis protein CcmE
VVILRGDYRDVNGSSNSTRAQAQALFTATGCADQAHTGRDSGRRQERELMHPARKQRLYLVLFIALFSSIAVGLVVYALRGNINLFYPPADVAAGLAPAGQPIRVGGMVREGSIQRAEDSLAIRFQLTDYEANVDVVYVGILPDLFAEGQGAVASGVLSDDGVLEASEILAKHDENYMPPEVTEALENSRYDEKGNAK